MTHKPVAVGFGRPAPLVALPHPSSSTSWRFVPSGGSPTSHQMPYHSGFSVVPHSHYLTGLRPTKGIMPHTRVCPQRWFRKTRISPHRTTAVTRRHRTFGPRLVVEHYLRLHSNGINFIPMSSKSTQRF